MNSDETNKDDQVKIEPVKDDGSNDQPKEDTKE